MDLSEIKPGQKIGVFYYDHRSGAKAEIGEVAKLSLSGQVTLTDGKRYTAKGKEIGDIDPSYLCSVERAKEVMEKASAQRRQRETEQAAFIASPEGRRSVAAKAAVKVAISALNQHGWYGDVDGEMDVLESELEQKIRLYLKRHESIN